MSSIDYRKYVFFLGGHDAEMCEIKSILQQKGCQTYDKDLAWDTAKLSAYLSELQSLPLDSIPVFIELNLDVAYPQNSIIIDHHGEKAGIDKKTSLEKVAERLEIDLNGDQLLISANDRGHIRGMIRSGASRQQIEDIRMKDKIAQKITLEDEQLAEEAVRDLSEPLPGVAWIESKTKKTAPIIDRIFGRYNIIVIMLPENGMTVSGPGALIKWLYGSYCEKKKTSQFWQGGELPEYGFFGATESLAKNELLIEIRKYAVPVSQHIFLFPFIASSYDKKPVILGELFDELLANNDWGKPEPFKLFDCGLNGSNQSKSLNPSGECCLNYDEYSYFHEFVRKVLFTFHSYSSGESFIKDTDAISCFFKYKLNGPSTFKIDIIRGSDEEGNLNHHFPYRLAIRGITLRLFKTGVAIIGFDLHNYCYQQFEDIQRINDYGRRVYPQFMGDPFLMAPKGNFLADSITLDIKGRATVKEEFKFESYRIEDNEKGRLNVGKQITDLLGDKFCQVFYVKPIIDDRMFTLCWYMNDDLVGRMTKEAPMANRYSRRRGAVSIEADKRYPFETAEEWYRYVFIDGKGCTCPDKRTRGGLIAATTYRRWASCGTLYGISRYSLMCLCGSGAPPYIREHMRRHYRQMAELLLAQRASMIVFSNRISDLSGEIDDLDINDRKGLKGISRDIRKLHGDYIGFVNRLWFDVVTPQEQGTEMYDIAMKNMRLKEQMQELKAEIKELYEFIEMQETNSMNQTMLSLTKVASIGIPVSVVLAFWGISDSFVKLFAWRSYSGWSAFLVSLAGAFFLGIGIYYKATKGGKNE